MNEMNKNRQFIAYEYKEISAGVEKASFLLDGYENFGWEADHNIGEIESGNGGYRDYHHYGYNFYPRNVIIRLKRNRRIINKAELTRLQRNFEACVKEIETMERSKTSMATIYALVIGLIGTAFMAGSVFAVTAQPPRILMCILLAVPAFLGWLLPYFVYQSVKRKQTEKINPYIEAKYDEIYEICEKGNKLLN